MRRYSKLLALIAMKMMKNGLKVLLGYNEKIFYQIDSVSQSFNEEDLRLILSQNIEYEDPTKKINSKKCEIKKVNENINRYLRKKNARRVIIFSDFDAQEEIEDLSNDCEIWWFCFNRISELINSNENHRITKHYSVKNFKGHYYNSANLEDFVNHLKNINSKKYEKKQRALIEGGTERE